MADILYLSRRDVEACQLDLAEVIELVEFSLIEHAHGRTEMPPKIGVHPKAGCLLHAMPAMVARAQAAGIKWVSAFPPNAALQIPTVGGLIVLNHPETGLPDAVMDAGWITAIRTVASVAVAARKLARPEARRAAVIGLGVLGHAVVPALRSVLPELSCIRAFAPNPSTRAGYKFEIERKLAVQVLPVESAQSAVSGADVIVTAAPWPAPMSGHAGILGELPEGVFGCALDFDSSFSPGSVATADRFFADDSATFEFYRNRGSFPGWPSAEELSRTLAGQLPGRKRPEERIVAANLGLGIYDIVVAREILGRARQRNIGQMLPA